MNEEIGYKNYWVTERERVCLDCGYKVTGISKYPKVMLIKEKKKCLECGSKNLIISERYVELSISDKLKLR